ncbi:MAG: asparagine synthase (glutamine-hydrolyzing) [Gemmatimonadaceae bacterium]
MCGIAGLFGPGWNPRQLDTMVAYQNHRGPDLRATYADPSQNAMLGHNRLSIIDLSKGAQPMVDRRGRMIVFNGEIYNYLEIRAELSDYPFQSRSDTEAVLAAYERWGESCLDHFTGMFAFMIWDPREQRLFAARDRFGVKPLYYHCRKDGGLAVASEVGTLRAAGIGGQADAVTWATYLAQGLTDHSSRTFWEDITSLPGGHKLTWRDGMISISRWYDLAGAVGEAFDERSDAEVEREYTTLMEDSVRLRFRSDVPVGINLSGGVDSSLLLGLVHAIQGAESDVTVFTFVTNDSRYDELPWVQQMLDRTRHRLVRCALSAEQVPDLAISVQGHEDGPFGGIPTLAYARVFEEARAEGVTVLLDGQGMDEQWAGYDYYHRDETGLAPSFVQGTETSPVRPECLTPDFAALAEPFDPPRPFSDRLRNLQYRDAVFTKIPRALRFNDRVSMRSSRELREPFLDHRLFELALRQPSRRKIQGDTGKWMLRELAKLVAPPNLVTAPKRPLQTPQREWLRGPLADWAGGLIDDAVAVGGGAWLDADKVSEHWERFRRGEGENSFFVWQWINLGLASKHWD